MRELYEIRERLEKELKQYGGKEMNSGSLDVIDKLTHAIKNLDKIIECDEQQDYSGRHRDSMGRYSREYSREYSRNYSYNDDMVAELKKLMHDAPDESTRQDIKRLIHKMESM